MTPQERAAQREAYEERAAIMEFDGNLPRAKAERLAGQLHPGPWTKPAEQLPLVPARQVRR